MSILFLPYSASQCHSPHPTIPPLLSPLHKHHSPASDPLAPSPFPPLLSPFSCLCEAVQASSGRPDQAASQCALQAPDPTALSHPFLLSSLPSSASVRLSRAQFQASRGAGILPVWMRARSRSTGPSKGVRGRTCRSPQRLSQARSGKAQKRRH